MPNRGVRNVKSNQVLGTYRSTQENKVNPRRQLRSPLQP